MKDLAELIPVTTQQCVEQLQPYTDLDWNTVHAADLDWTCSYTALHIADDLYFYALQVIRAQSEGYACTELSLDDHATPDLLLESIILHGELLRRVAQAADPGVRAYHTYGASDPAGFAAMGMVETLIHTYDLVRGLDSASTWRPPAELAAPRLDRLFPDAPAGDAAEVLLHCCGRVPLGETPRLHKWRWDGTVHD
jgi:hypothetical protein